MFCTNCGKSISVDGNFCAHCGKSVSLSTKPRESSTTEWEYTYYLVRWDKGGKYPLTFGKTEYQVRLDNWGSDQSWILPEIQNYLDKGWVPVTEVGPGGYGFVTIEEYASGIKITSLSVKQFLVELRRSASPLSIYENRLLGTWEETGKFNQGFWNKLDNLIVYQKPQRKKWRYKFYKTRKFVRFTPDGDQAEGVFMPSESNEITLLFQHYIPGQMKAILQDEQLTCKAKGYQTMTFEKVSE